MSEQIIKLTNEEIAEALIDYREKRGVKTLKGEALTNVKDVFAVVSKLLKEDNVGITVGKVGLLYNGLQKGRTGTHPQTLEPIEIPAKRAIKYRPAPKYKDDLNG